MRISDWSSDVCSSDLPSRNNSYGAAHVLAQPKRDGLGVFACRIYGSWGCLSSGGLFPKRSGSRTGIAAFAQNGCKDETGRAHAELQSLMRRAYSVFRLENKPNTLSRSLFVSALV